MALLGKPAIATCDVCDKMGAAAVVVPIDFKNYGGRVDFSGPAVTLKTLDDNALVRKLVEGEGFGRVLILDGADSRRCALFGGNLAKLAADNGWAGIIVNGRIRDHHETQIENVGIKALGTSPRKPQQKGYGEVGVPVSLNGVIISSGDFITADADGVVLTKEKPQL